MLTDPRAILFDLDDTLVDRQAGLRSYSKILYSDFRNNTSGSSDDVLNALVDADDFGSTKQAERLSKHHIWTTRPKALELQEHWSANFGRSAKPFTGVKDLLIDLRRVGVKAGLITNGSSEMQRSKIKALDIEALLCCVIISAEVGISKPDSAVFNLALSHVGCEPHEAWFVGDHPNLDVLAAKSAGLCAFRVCTGAMRDAVCDDGINLRSLSDLRAYLPILHSDKQHVG